MRGSTQRQRGAQLLLNSQWPGAGEGMEHAGCLVFTCCFSLTAFFIFPTFQGTHHCQQSTCPQSVLDFNPGSATWTHGELWENRDPNAYPTDRLAGHTGRPEGKTNGPSSSSLPALILFSLHLPAHCLPRNPLSLSPLSHLCPPGSSGLVPLLLAALQGFRRYQMEGWMTGWT